MQNTKLKNRGAILPIMVISFTFVIAMAAFGIDVGYMQMVKNELRTAVDAATRAGASGLRISPAEARKRAKDIAATNIVNGKALTLKDSDISLGTWNPTTRTFTALSPANENNATAIQITGLLSKDRDNSIRLIFAPIFGQSAKEMTINSVAAMGGGADVMIIQDITSSFKEELADAKTGDQALLTALYDNGAGGSRAAILVHTGWGKTLAAFQSIKTSYSSLSSIITGIQHCGSTGMPVCSGTDIAAGFDEALKNFKDPGYVASKGGKVVVLCSDGEPTSSSSGSHPSYSDQQLLTLARTRADELWALKVHIYVVFYNRDNDQTAANNLKSLIRGTGDFVQVTDAKQLPAALAEINQKLPVQLVR